MKAGKTSKIVIQYQSQKCKLKVKCTTLTEKQYKEKCESISYSDLARKPEEYDGNKIKIYGQIIQVLETDGENEVNFRVATKDSGFGSYYDDVFLVVYTYKDNEPRLLEDDMVTMWGMYGGTYTYESTLGSNITVPLLYAEYVKIN